MLNSQNHFQELKSDLSRFKVSRCSPETKNYILVNSKYKILYLLGFKKMKKYSSKDLIDRCFHSLKQTTNFQSCLLYPTFLVHKDASAKNDQSHLVSKT